VDNDAILLRAYGKGTEVLIDRDSRWTALIAAHGHNFMYGYLTFQQERQFRILCLLDINLLLRFLLVLKMVSSMNSSKAVCALPKIFVVSLFVVVWPVS